MRKLIFNILILSPFLLIGCAERRPIEKVPDPDQIRYEKRTFKGEQKQFYWHSLITMIDRGNSAPGAPEGAGIHNVGFFNFTKGNLQFLDAVTKEVPSRPARLENYLGCAQQDEGDSTRSGAVENCVSLKNKVLYSWPIQHSKYRLREFDGKTSNVEEEDRYVPWYEKANFKINFEKSALSVASYFFASCAIPKSADLVEGSQEVTSEYIGFDVQVQIESRCRGASGNHRAYFKYSFKRYLHEEAMKYKPYVYLPPVDDLGDLQVDPLDKKYGYFKVYKSYINRKSGINEYVSYMKRWNPDKTHVFYLSPDFPEKYKKVAHHVFKVTNDLFKKRKLKVRFELKEDKQKQFGDVRYSFVKAVTEELPRSLLGFGPSYSNPFTGEIVSASVVVWTAYLERFVKKYLAATEGAFDFRTLNQAKIISKMEQFLETPFNAWDKNSIELQKDPQYKKVISRSTRGIPFYFWTGGQWRETSSAAGELKKHVDSISEMKEGLFSEEFKEIISQVNEEALLTDRRKAQAAARYTHGLVGDHQSHGHSHGHQSHDYSHEDWKLELDDNHPLGNHEKDSGCEFTADHAVAFLGGVKVTGDGPSSDDVEKHLLSGVLFHELGHTLGLRHNFYGSIDFENFKHPTEGSSVGSSSIMDYGHMYYESQIPKGWMPYDEAALLYAYSEGKVDVSEEKGKAFLYCTDEHVFFSYFCKKFDRGSTPSQILIEKIKDYVLLTEILRKRWGRFDWNPSIRRIIISSLRKMVEMKRMLAFYYEISGHGNHFDTDESINEIRTLSKSADSLKKNTKEAVKLSIAFFNAIVAQDVDKDFIPLSVDSFSGKLKQIGNMLDRIYALLIFLSDFSVNDYSFARHSTTSYVDLLLEDSDPELRELTKRTLLGDQSFPGVLTIENPINGILPGLTLLSYNVYMSSATNYHASRFPELSDRGRLHCFTESGYEKTFGQKPPFSGGDVYVAEVNCPASQRGTPYFVGSSSCLVTKFYEHYYVTSERNIYSHKIMKDMKTSLEQSQDDSVPLALSLLGAYHQIYGHSTTENSPKCVDGSE